MEVRMATVKPINDKEFSSKKRPVLKLLLENGLLAAWSLFGVATGVLNPTIGTFLGYLVVMVAFNAMKSR